MSGLRLLRIGAALPLIVNGGYLAIHVELLLHDFDSTLSAPLRFTRTVLCALLAVLAVRLARERRDALFVLAVMAVVVAADVFLILIPRFLVGLGLFAVVHALLLIRHLRDLRASLARPEVRRLLRIEALIIAAVGVGLSLVFFPQLGAMRALFAAYFALLLVGSWAAIATIHRDTWPRPCAVGIAVGMVLFAICDVALGLGEALRMPVLRRVVPDLTYTLALLGIVLSTVDWDAPPRPGRTTI